MNTEEIRTKVFACISQIAQEQSIPLKAIQMSQTVVEDLGFKSLDVATLTAYLESAFHVDPFSSGMAVITEIRTVGDICSVYDRCLNGKANDEMIEVDAVSDARMQKRLSKKTA